MLGAHALDVDGVWLGTNLSSQSDYWVQRDACWLTHVDDQGACAEPVQLELGGDPRCSVDSVLREPNSLVLAGTVSWPFASRGHVQRRALDGEALAEAEFHAPVGEDVSRTRVYAHPLNHYMVEYTGNSPYNPGTYRAGAVVDASLSPTDQFGLPSSHLGYVHDVLGRLYWISRDAFLWEYDPIPSAPPPIAIYVQQLAAPDQPPHDEVELAIPQPQCGDPDVLAVRDETTVGTRCTAPDAPDTLMGYLGPGDPSWTATLNCSGVMNLERIHGTFSDDGRLWLAGSGRVVVVEFG